MFLMYLTCKPPSGDEQALYPWQRDQAALPRRRRERRLRHRMLLGHREDVLVRLVENLFNLKSDLNRIYY